MTTPFPSSVRRVLFQIGDTVRTGAERYPIGGGDPVALDEITLWVIAVNTLSSSAGSFIQYQGWEPEDAGTRCYFTNFYALPDGSPPRLATEQERIDWQVERKAHVDKANAEYSARKVQSP